MGTTAIFRTQAYEAAEKLNWELAGELYQKAHDVYPPFPAGSALQEKDKAELLKKAKHYKSYAANSTVE